jgi:YVTN family beta-propeller protein
VVTPIAVPTAAPSAAPATPKFSKLRVFVASESADSLVVLEGGSTFEVVGTVPVGRFPHNISVSPNAKWLAVADRLGNTVTIVDPLEMKQLSRVRVGKQPHDLIWHPDSGTLFVGHERDGFIARIQAGSWKMLPPLVVGVPQHDLAIVASRPTELYYSVTNSEQWDHLRLYDLSTNAITKIKVQDVHDVFFTPDESEIWTTSSGFIDVHSDRIVITDPARKEMKQELRFGGRYPFHTMKKGRDGAFFPPAGTPMLLSDHGGPSLLFIDVAERRIASATKLGEQPFHTTYDPLGDRLLVTSNVANEVAVIDLATREVKQRVRVTAPHGIVAVGIP